MTSVLESIEREAELVANRASLPNSIDLDSAAAAGEALIAEYERMFAAETKKIEESRAAFERGEIAKEDVYSGDSLTTNGYVRFKVATTFRGEALELGKAVHVESLRRSPAHLIVHVRMVLREEVKSRVIQTLCEEARIDVIGFKDRLCEERLAAAKKMLLKDSPTPAPAEHS